MQSTWSEVLQLQKMNHFAKACLFKKGQDSKKQKVRKVLTDDDSSTEPDSDTDSEVSSRIVVGNLSKKNKLTAKVSAQGEEMKLNRYRHPSDITQPP